MKLLVENVYTQIKNATKKELRIIDKALAYHVPNYQFMPAFKNRRWDGKKHFLNKRWNIFPTGLLVFIDKLAQKKNFKLKIKDKRKHFKPKKKNIRKAIKLLRSYQAPELKKCLVETLRDIPWF